MGGSIFGPFFAVAQGYPRESDRPFLCRFTLPRDVSILFYEISMEPVSYAAQKMNRMFWCIFFFQ